jgi:hypothetical protein
MKIKSFKLFENTENPQMSFTVDQFDAFCEAVSKWEETGEKVFWAIYLNPNKQEGYNSLRTKDTAKKYWEMYLRGGKTFTLAELGDSLVGILHKGDQVEMAYDNLDNRIDESSAKTLLGQ